MNITDALNQCLCMYNSAIVDKNYYAKELVNKTGGPKNIKERKRWGIHTQMSQSKLQKTNGRKKGLS